MSTASESYLVGLIGDGITRSLTPPHNPTLGSTSHLRGSVGT